MANLKFEIKRKLFHLTGILFIPFYFIFYFYINKTAALIALVTLLIFFLIVEFFRIKLSKKIPFFNILYRDEEKNKLSKNIHFTLAAIIVFGLFDFKIASTAILMATLGDIAAAVIGIKFGKHWLKRFPKRAWEGIIAEFAVDLIIAIFILNSFVIALPMAFFATLTETTVDFIDDNFSVPVVASVVAHLVKIIKV